MNLNFSHDRKDETPEAKALWFQSLSIQQRQELFCQYMDLILEVNPKIVERKNAQPVAGRIRVITND